MKIEAETIIGQGKVFIDENKIIHAIPVGDIDGATAAAFVASINRYMNGIGKNASGIVDLNKCGKQTTEARQIFKTLNDNENVGRLAFLGFHPVAKVLANFAITFSKNRNIHFFTTEEEALAWLMEVNNG